MKIYIALILSCVSVLGADTGIRIATTTSSAGVHHDGIYKTDVFTRDGQTNLICNTWTKDGALAMRTQSFYHDGLLVGKSMATPDFQDFATEASSAYSVRFTFGPSNKTRFVYISAKDGEILDVFTCTNGVYYPADSHLILEVNDRVQAARKFSDLSRFLIAHQQP